MARLRNLVDGQESEDSPRADAGVFFCCPFDPFRLLVDFESESAPSSQQRSTLASVMTDTHHQQAMELHEDTQVIKGAWDKAAWWGAGVTGVTAAAMHYAHTRNHIVHHLNPSIKVFVPAAAGYIAYLMASTTDVSKERLKRRETMRPRNSEAPIFTENAHLGPERANAMANMSDEEKAVYWLHRHPFAGIGVMSSPLLAYVGYQQWKNPHLSFSQRILQTRLLGQGTLLGAVAATAAVQFLYSPPALITEIPPRSATRHDTPVRRFTQGPKEHQLRDEASAAAAVGPQQHRSNERQLEAPARRFSQGPTEHKLREEASSAAAAGQQHRNDTPVHRFAQGAKEKLHEASATPAGGQQQRNESPARRFSQGPTEHKLRGEAPAAAGQQHYSNERQRETPTRHFTQGPTEHKLREEASAKGQQHRNERQQEVSVPAGQQQQQQQQRRREVQDRPAEKLPTPAFQQQYHREVEDRPADKFPTPAH